MILTTHIPYLRRKHSFSAGDHMGSVVAHADLLVNALRYRIVEQACFVSDYGLVGDPAALNKVAASDPALAELRSEFGSDRVRTVESIDLAKMDGEAARVWVTKVPLAVQYAQLSDALGGKLGPSCSLVHAVNSPNLVVAHLSAWCLHEPYDVMVATSVAAERAVNSVIDQTGEMLRSRFGLATLPQRPRVVHIPLGVEAHRFKPVDRSLARQLLQLPDNAVALLYFGRLDQRYKADLEPLLLSLTILRAEFPEVILILAGQDTGGTGRRFLATKAAELGIEEAVVIAADVSPAVKQLLYSAADIFVSPADNIQESFGLTLLEAMASGLPVVASDWSGYRDIVDHGRTGFLVPTLWNSSVEHTASLVGPVAAVSQLEALIAETTAVDIAVLIARLRTLVSNRVLRCEFGACGRARVQQMFSWSDVCRQFGELWQDQHRQFRAAQRTSKSPATHLRYGEIFAHYATSTVDSAMQVCRTARGAAWLDGGLLSPPVFNRVDRRRITEILRLTQDPVPVSDLLDRLGDTETTSISWLIKKDGLGVVQNGHAPGPGL